MDAMTWAKGGMLALRIDKMLTNWNTRVFQEARDEMFREWISELQNAVNELQRTASSDQLRVDVGDPNEAREYERVFANYCYEAAREAIDERRRMLAYAAAGTFNVNMTPAEAARIERKLRELDAADVLRLGEILELNQRGIRRDYQEDPSVAALLAGGFFHDTYGWGCIKTPGAMLTPDGSRLRQIMQGYFNACIDQLSQGNAESG